MPQATEHTNNDGSIEDLPDAAAVPEEQQELVSPPGMVMRSGKKKRRRSRETSGLTPEQELTAKKRSRAGATHATKKARPAEEKDGDTNEEEHRGEEYLDDNTGDEEMEDDDDDDGMGNDGEEGEVFGVEPQPQVHASVNSVALSHVVEATTDVAPGFPDDVLPVPTKVAPAQNLRLPSEQTPGKWAIPANQLPDTPYDNHCQGLLVHDEIQEEVIEPPPEISPVPDSLLHMNDTSMPDEPQVTTPVRRLFRTIRSTIKDIIVPSAADLDLDDDDMSEQSFFAYRPHFWFAVIVLLQGLCFQFYLNPVLTTMYEMTSDSILWYKGIIGIEPTVIQNITEVEVIVPVPSPPKKVTKIVETHVTDSAPAIDDTKVVQHIEKLAGAKDDYVNTISTMVKEKEKIENDLDEVRLALMDKEDSLKAWDAALSEAELEVNVLLESPPIDVPKVVKERDVVPVLQKLKAAALMYMNTDVVTAQVPMWEVVSSSGCPQPPSSDNDRFITTADAEEGNAKLNAAAQETVQQTIQDSEIEETIKDWVQDELEQTELAVSDVERDEIVESGDADGEDMGLVIGVTGNEAKKIIDERLDASLSDTVGLLDVAAKYNGAEVIRRGARATTPSLVQSLPILNRLMAATKLRFYGHGPDAALTPTIPPDALGQCWSFENISKSRNPRWNSVYKRDKANGRYASLTVKLAKATPVKRVIIEHNASPEKKESSAIMDFRVVGFADGKARGNPIHLGAFRYDKEGSASQEFQLTDANDHLQSITLAIDSTHSKDYACLYRFRVLEN